VFDKWFELGAAVVIGVLAWFFKRELGNLEKKANKDDLTAALTRLDTHLRECREQHEKVSDQLLHVSTAIARIEGRLNGK
jgi:hypothetical protein